MCALSYELSGQPRKGQVALFFLIMIFRRKIIGGGERDRTDDLLLAKQALSQLSYTPRQETGGSGWIRTIDPRLIKTVL